MTATWARNEQRTADALNATRTHRAVGESAPDVRGVFPNGERAVFEVKTRAALPGLPAAALRQAAGYDRGAIPVAVVIRKGAPEDGIAFMRLADLQRVLGIIPPPAPAKSRPVPRGPRQLTLLTDPAVGPTSTLYQRGGR